MLAWGHDAGGGEGGVAGICGQRGDHCREGGEPRMSLSSTRSAWPVTIACLLVILVMLARHMDVGEAHQAPCHRLHSCPSDHGTYVCGDKGHCDQCPDHQYCLAGKPRTASHPSVTPRTPSAPHIQIVKVSHVIDGDTLALDSGEDVRLIGVDTPETKHPKKPVERFGKEATAFTKQLVEGQEVRLAYGQQRRDKYDRTLAYVYLLDGTFLNAEIIRQGYRFAYTRFPFKYLEEFRRLEREAREAKRGLWGP
jgi:endonuclease YncB( thermonuclease family)